MKTKDFSFNLDIFLNLKSPVIDAWGTIPFGFVSGNTNSLGSFQECFNIKQNGSDFKTQYCIAQLKLPSNDDSNKVKNSWTM